ncbi:MAG: hypothetical protein PHH12_01655 [Candidatus Shapirobacteria bacterium]|nr:hypothetical protein [Candidatus Shapirobacteria bacterium]
MNKKSGIILILILVLGVFGFIAFKDKTKTTEQTLSLNDKSESTFLIEGFPIEQVPLYKLNKVSSNKIFVNTDPRNISDFEENNFAYFNVVFYSDASQEEFLNYYKNLFESEIVKGFKPTDMVKGKIGEYQVSAAHYGSDNTGYIQVHLPNYQDENLNKYFIDFPNILATNTNLVEHEKSYGLLNQKGGEVEFTKYFTVIDSGDKDNDGKDDVDEFLLLEEEYKKQYKDKSEYIYDEKMGTMKWKDGGFEITLVISRDHGRIYITLRKSLI